MPLLQLAPVNGSDGGILTVDLDQWQQSPSLEPGGFSDRICTNPSNPDIILKRMSKVVELVDALPSMGDFARHAKVMGQRLIGIIGEHDTLPFVRSICQVLFSTLTTHIGHSIEEKKIYLYQRRAPGISLEEALVNNAAPVWADRVRIAKNFASVMYALRRCNVIHLDPRPPNVFVNFDSTNLQVTLIDLDGCGVLPPEGSRLPPNSWFLPPSTMGKTDDMAKPLWFPIDWRWQGPLSGNFKFAERWCVLNEVWKIMSWGVTALGWLEPEHDDLLLASERVIGMFDHRRNQQPLNQYEAIFLQCQRDVSISLRPLMQTVQEHTKSIKWHEYNLGQGALSDETFLRELAFMTLWSFINPKDKRLPGTPQRQDAHEIPSAQWIQNALFQRYG